MNKEDMMKGRGLVKGIAEGEALVSSESLVWSHGVDPEPCFPKSSTEKPFP